LWTFQGSQNVASCADSVLDASVVYPRVLIAVTVAQVLTYAIPIAYGVALVPTDQTLWQTGTLANVGTVASPFLGNWVLFGGAMSGIIGGLTSTHLYALLIARLAESELLPLGDFGRVLKVRGGRFLFFPAVPGVPSAAIVLLTCTTLCLQFIDFTHIVATDTAMNIFAFFLVAVSYLRLRLIARSLERPFRVPGGNFGAFAVGGCCASFAVLAFAIVCWGEWYAALSTALAVVIFYWASQYAAQPVTISSDEAQESLLK
jgi:hypothetical protein